MRAWDDQRVEEIIGNLLRYGVLLAAAVVLAGAAIYLARNGGAHPDYRIFKGEPSDLRHVRGILADVRSLRGRGIIQLGLLLLIATPVARVAFSIAAFAMQRDRMYVVITLVVFLILLYSLTGS
jgi:uncharacterized membrane protein